MFSKKNPSTEKISEDDDELNFSLTYNMGDVISFNINPADKRQWFGHSDRFHKFHAHYTELLSTLFDMAEADYDYWFRIELSEPISTIVCSEGSRLHLHGFLKFKTKVSVYKFLLTYQNALLTLASVKIKHIKSQDQLDGWIKYCTKQIHYLPKQAYFTNTLDKGTGAIFSDYIATIE